jgi:hypothetical protein
MNHTKKYLDRLSQNAAEAGAEDIGKWVALLDFVCKAINKVPEKLDTRFDIYDNLAADLYALADHARDLHKQAEGWQEAMDDGKAYEADFRRDCDAP